MLLEWGASLVAQTVKNLTAMLETRVRSVGQKDSPGEGSIYPFKYCCLGKPRNRGAWWATVHGVAKSWTRLND